MNWSVAVILASCAALSSCAPAVSIPEISVSPPPGFIEPGQEVPLAASTTPAGLPVTWSFATPTVGSVAALSSEGIFSSPAPGLFTISAVAVDGKLQSEPAYVSLEVRLPESNSAGPSSGGTGTTGGSGTTGAGQGSTNATGTAGRGSGGGTASSSATAAVTSGGSGSTAGRATSGGTTGGCRPSNASCTTDADCCNDTCRSKDGELVCS